MTQDSVRIVLLFQSTKINHTISNWHECVKISPKGTEPPLGTAKHLARHCEELSDAAIWPCATRSSERDCDASPAMTGEWSGNSRKAQAFGQPLCQHPHKYLLICVGAIGLWLKRMTVPGLPEIVPAAKWFNRGGVGQAAQCSGERGRRSGAGRPFPWVRAGVRRSLSRRQVQASPVRRDKCH